MRSCFLVTVVIPAFNVAPWLPMLFDGLDGQTFRDFETIFVDDGSTDKTGALLDAYAASQDGVRVLHQSNRGVSAARNAGVDAASGKYIAFIDGDDTVAPSYLDDLFSLSTSLDLDFAMCNGWRLRELPGDMNEHSLFVLPKPEGVMSGVEWFEATFSEGMWCGNVYMTMVRRDFLLHHKIRFMEGIIAEDILWNALVQSKAKRVAYKPKQNYYYRCTPGSIMNNTSLAGKLRMIYSGMLVIEELWRMADTETPRIAALFNRLGTVQGRILLRQVAGIGSLRPRIAISTELRRRGFLSRLFRKTETIGHRRRIFMAYWHAWLGAFAGETTSAGVGRPENAFLQGMKSLNP